MEFAYAGGGLGKGGTSSRFRRWKQVGQGRQATAAMIFSADDGCDVGATTVRPSHRTTGRAAMTFTGTVKGVQLAIAEDAESLDHLVKPEDAVAMAMARQ